MIKKFLSSKNTKVIVDLCYTIGAALILQIAQQIIVYPWINRTWGDEALGEVVYYMGILFIVAMSAGVALCNGRMVDRNNYTLTNGDVSPMLLIFSGVVALFTAVYTLIDGKDIWFALSFSLLSVLMVVRYYIQVEYRLTKNFKGQLLFNIIISLGFLVGLLLFGKTFNWIFIFILGELAVIVYIIIKGTVLRPEKSGGNVSLFAKTAVFLLFSCLTDNLISQWDRIAMAKMIDTTATAQFFAFSTAGKSLQMLVGPINILLISNLTANGNEKIDGKKFKKIFTILLGLSGGVYLLTLIFTPIFIKLFYPNMSEALTFGMNALINLFHVINLSSSIIFILLLIDRGAKTHMTIQLLYCLLFIGASTAGTYLYEMKGFVIAGIATGILRFLIIILICLKRPQGTQGTVVP